MKTNRLYLDDARIGRMKPTARILHNLFLDCASEFPSSQELLSIITGEYEHVDLKRHGWSGINQLRNLAGQQLANASSDQICIASRTRSLMLLAIQMMRQWVGHCLLFDNGWPLFHRDLTDELARNNRRTSMINVRDKLWNEHWTSRDLCDYICAESNRLRCDGVLITAMDSLGTKIPVLDLCRQLRAETSVDFIVVDATQSLGQYDCSDQFAEADLVISSTHKWVGSYLPLAIACASNSMTSRRVMEFISLASRSNHECDHLTHFDECLKLGCDTKAPETVNLSCLFAACGALLDSKPPHNTIVHENRSLVEHCIRSSGWRFIGPIRSFQERVIVIRPNRMDRVSASTSNRLRNIMESLGIVVSTYDGGMMRLALPSELLSAAQLDLLQSALTLASEWIMTEEKSKNETWSLQLSS